MDFVGFLIRPYAVWRKPRCCCRTWASTSKTPNCHVDNLFFQKAEDTGQQARVVHDSIFHHEKLSGDLEEAAGVGEGAFMGCF